ncbi:MAG: hypothetical protein KJ067_05525 [Vicinamibacteria bacterium]|nr:hypothetical protein [Vicinamibacteria bacterium]
MSLLGPDFARWFSSSTLRSHAPALLIPLAVLLAFEPLWAGREVLWGDFVSWYVPSHHYASGRLWQGALPLWNPYSDSGMPFMGEADHGTLYPPSLLLHVLGRDPVRLFDLLQAFTLLHLVWAGLSLYGLARSLGRSGWAATFGGVAFALSGALVARASHVSLVCAISWLPLVFGGLHASLRSGRLRPALWACTGFGMIALSGSPSTVVVAAVGAVALAIGTCSGGTRQAWAASARALGLAAAVAIGGTALGAAQLLPMRELVQHSERSAYSYDDIAAYALDPDSLVLLAVPRAFGWLRYEGTAYWGPPNFAELGGYAGLLTLAFAWLALTRGASGEARPWAVLAGAGLWLALGRSGGLHQILYVVPVVGEMRAPGRFLALWAVGVALLASQGLDLAIARGSRRALAAWRWRTLAGFGLVAVWVGHHLAPGAPGLEAWQRPVASLAFLASFGSLALAAGWLLLAGRPRLRAAAGWAACAVLALDLAVQWRGVGLHRRDEMVATLGRDDARYDRIVAAEGTDLRLKSRYANPGRLLVNRVPAESGPGRHLLAYERFQAAIRSHDSPLLDLLHVGYLAEVRSRSIRAPGPNLVAEEGLWLARRAAVELPVDPEVVVDGIELVLTIDPRGEPPGSTIGEVEVAGEGGVARRHLLRLGVESGHLAGGPPPRAAERIDVRHFVHVRDAGALRRTYYRAELRGDLAGPVRRILLRHAGADGTALVVKEVRLLAEPRAGDRWMLVREEFPADGFPLRLYRNTRVGPRAWVARRATWADSPQRAIDRLEEGGFDPRVDVALEAPAGLRGPSDEFPHPTPAGTASVERAEPERIVVRARLERRGWLVISEVDYPGWIARAGGVSLPIVRAQGLFRAVRLDAGEHVVSFEYRPGSFRGGLALSLAAAFALALAWLRVRRTGS